MPAKREQAKTKGGRPATKAKANGHGESKSNGANGAGKTSAFNCITGFYRPTGGSVKLDGHNIARLRPSAIAARGVSRTFQNPRLFGELTVLDNVRAGMHLRLRQSALDALLHLPRFRRSEREATDEANRWLDFVGRGLDQELGDGWCDNLHPADFDRVLDTYHAAFDARRPYEMEFRLQREDGAWRWLLERGSPIFAPNGDFEGYIGTDIDITEHRETVEALRESRARFGRRASASHHFGGWPGH